jgi:agmatine deiminase
MRIRVVVLSLGLLLQATLAQAQLVENWDEAVQGPMPRWRMGGTPPVDPNQSLLPRVVYPNTGLSVPTSGYIESPPEYWPTEGVIFRYSTSAWAGVVSDCVAALTGDPAHDEVAYVVLSSPGQQTIAQNQFSAAGADMSKVVFIIMSTNSIWLRDYGPHYIWQSNTRSIVDSHYYPERPADNFLPTLLGDDEFTIPTWDIGLYYSGGNFQPGVARTGYVTSLINQDNPLHGEPLIAELYQTYQGIDSLHIFPRLPSSVDATGHIDMWFYLVDDDTVVISEFLPGSNASAIAITDNAATYMAGIGYEVIRVPDHNGFHPQDPQAHFTYANAFRVNDRIFIPSYGDGDHSHDTRDAQALAAWQTAAPEAEIVPIDCYPIIYAAGAIHCIVMQVPRYTDAVPSAHLTSPDGGELLVAGTTHILTWAATDDIKIGAVDLAYSTDGGATFPNVIVSGYPQFGEFDWTVPAAATSEAVVRVTAWDTDGNFDVAVSETTFALADAPQHVYDFSTGAGVDKWAWGYQSQTWSSLDGVRRPAATAIEIETLVAGAYAQIAASDATGSDSDTNRYDAPTPIAGRESTHIFEFIIDEAPADMLDIGILWEGYGDACLQMELYLWDDVEGNWAGSDGLFGENRYFDNFAGNRDEALEAHIRSDFDRYIVGSGKLTLLVYGERQGEESFHDYVAVTVTYMDAAIPGDLDGDGVVGILDFLQLLGEWGACPAPPAECAGDLDGDGIVGILDFLELLANWT